jgi:hypothetical protein
MPPSYAAASGGVLQLFRLRQKAAKRPPPGKVCLWRIVAEYCDAMTQELIFHARQILHPSRLDFGALSVDGKIIPGSTAHRLDRQYAGVAFERRPSVAAA